MGKTFRYFDDWQNEILTCPTCGWSGTFEEGVVEIYEYLTDSSCPDCDWMETPILAKVPHMNLRDAAENLEKLNKVERRFLIGGREHIAKDIDTSLRFSYELPEIDDSSIMIAWDFLEEDGTPLTSLKHGNREIWREKAIYGGYERFFEIAALIKFKYGDRLLDVIPTPESIPYLYGDDNYWVVNINLDVLRSSIQLGFKNSNLES